MSSPTVRRLQLGRELRRLREHAHVSREQAAEELECNLSKISKIETGRMTLAPAEVKALVRLYQVPEDEAEQIYGIAREARKRATYRVPDWARAYYGLEAEALEIRDFHIDLIPGLLQTPEYTRAIARAAAPTGDPAEIDRIVATRKERQERLTGPNPPKLWVVMHEAAVRTKVGGPQVMRAQIAQVMELAALPMVSVQVVPFDAGSHGSMGTSFMILRLPDTESPIVYLEDLWSADYLSRPAQVQDYTSLFDRLCSTALSAEDTATLLQEVTGGL